MKKIFLTFGIALLGFTVAVAQDAGSSDAYEPTETEAIESEAPATESEEVAPEDIDATEAESDAIKEENTDIKTEEETTVE